MPILEYFLKYCCFFWEMLQINLPKDCKSIHLLWGLMFLKIYSTENVRACTVCADEKTFRKWPWLIVKAISKLDLVSLYIFWIRNRYLFLKIHFETQLRNKSLEGSFMSIHGTDFKINEPSPFDKSWFSHRYNGPGVRYKIGISIETPKIVWSNGPRPCGAYSDLKIFRDGLKHLLKVDGFVLADSGYTDERCIQPPGSNQKSHRLLSLIRARHEYLNKRIKQFGLLNHKFRHDLSLHHYCFFLF